MKNLSIFKSRNIDMTQGPIAKNLILFAVPIILSEFLQQLYNVCDSIIVGKCVGAEALAAVSGTNTITNLVIGAFTGIALGATVVISRLFGAKNREGISRALDSIVKFTIICSVLFTILALSLTKQLLNLTKIDQNIYMLSYRYLMIYFLGTPALLTYNMISGILKAVGNSTRPLITLAITAVSNVVLDLLFVAVFDLGVTGAALATIIAQYVSAVVICIMLSKDKSFDNPVIRKQPIDLKVIKEVLAIGIPMGMQKVIVHFSNTIAWSYINQFGTNVTAAWGAYYKLDNFIINTFVGLSSALTTFTAQHIGAGKYDRIHKGTLICVGLSMSIVTVYILLFSCFAEFFASWFTDSAEIILICVTFLRYLLPGNLINVIPHTLSGNLRGKGYSMHSTILLTLNYVILRQAYLYLYPATATDVTAVAAAWPLTFISCTIMTVAFYFYTIKKKGY